MAPCTRSASEPGASLHADEPRGDETDVTVGFGLAFASGFRADARSLGLPSIQHVRQALSETEFPDTGPGGFLEKK